MSKFIYKGVKMKNPFFAVLFMIFLLASGCSSGKDKIFGMIQSCSELATLKVTLSKYIFAEQVNRILMIPIGHTQFVAQSEVILKYGIKMDRIMKEDIKLDKNKISIILPPVELLDFNYSPKLDIVEEYTTMHNWVTQIAGIMRQAEDSVRSNLQYLDIKNECRQKTRDVLTRIFRNSGFTDIDISFKKD
jgi:hypothetical protein